MCSEEEPFCAGLNLAVFLVVEHQGQECFHRHTLRQRLTGGGSVLQNNVFVDEIPFVFGRESESAIAEGAFHNDDAFVCDFERVHDCTDIAFVDSLGEMHRNPELIAFVFADSELMVQLNAVTWLTSTLPPFFDCAVPGTSISVICVVVIALFFQSQKSVAALRSALIFIFDVRFIVTITLTTLCALTAKFPVTFGSQKVICRFVADTANCERFAKLASLERTDLTQFGRVQENLLRTQNTFARLALRKRRTRCAVSERTPFAETRRWVQEELVLLSALRTGTQRGAGDTLVQSALHALQRGRVDELVLGVVAQRTLFGVFEQIIRIIVIAHFAFGEAFAFQTVVNWTRDTHIIDRISKKLCSTFVTLFVVFENEVLLRFTFCAFVERGTFCTAQKRTFNAQCSSFRGHKSLIAFCTLCQ